MRAENRLIDPNTNEVYHKVFNPPPENDKKLIDRLKPVEVNMEEIEKQVLETNSHSELLAKRFRSEFGIENAYGKQYLYQELNGKRDKSEIESLVKGEVSKILENATQSWRHIIDDFQYTESVKPTDQSVLAPELMPNNTSGILPTNNLSNVDITQNQEESQLGNEQTIQMMLEETPSKD